MKKLLWIGAVLLGLLIISGIAGTCNSANDELAKTARVAVENSREAMRQNDAAYLWPGRLRILAIVLGVVVPIAAAVILAGLAFRHRPEELEVLSLALSEQKRLGLENQPGKLQVLEDLKAGCDVLVSRDNDSTPK